MIKPTLLSVPRQYRKGMTALYIRSIIKTLLQLFVIKKNQHERNSRKGFKKRYASGNLYGKYFDGTIDWYLSPLHFCEAHFSLLPNTQEKLALDLGCGPASVCHWLRNNDYEWSYMGVDEIKEAENFFVSLSQAKFLEKNMEHLKASDLPQKADIVFAVNSFCYASDIDSLLTSLHQYTTHQAKLVIVDPQPSIFWDNITLASSYTPDDWHEILSNNNWHVERTFRTSIYCLWNIPLMNISQALLCTKIN